MSFKEQIKEFGKTLIDTVYPTGFRCYVCGDELAEDVPFGICEKCALPFNDGHICAHCGKPVENEAEYCERCMHSDSLLRQARSALVYENSASELIRGLKFGRKKYLMECLAPVFKLALEKLDTTPDLIVPVPLTEKRFRARGFNQAQLLAQVAAEHFQAEMVEVLDKIKDAPDQARLTAAERAENIKDSFVLNDKADVRGHIVLIVDDVMTTGATLEACAAALNKGKPAAIVAATLASGRQKVNLV